MGSRSLRNKIRWQAEKVLGHVDSMFEHWRYLDELADNQSPFISETLPILLAALSEYKEAVKKFRESL